MLVKLKQLLSKGLEQTGTLWPPVTLATDWVHQAATILNNQAGLKAKDVQQSLNRLLLSMSDWKEQTGEMADKINHFLKVTRSYEPGLFHCYQIQGLPRTNNDLEQAFGQLRHHQRRVTSRKAAPASLVRAGISSALGCGCHSHSNVYCSRLWHDFSGTLAGRTFQVAKTSC